MNLREYIESLPSEQSRYYPVFYDGTLSQEQTLTLAHILFNECWLECTNDVLFYNHQSSDYSNETGKLSYCDYIEFYFQYPDYTHRRYTFKLGIDVRKFRSMLIYKSIDYDKPIGE